MTGSCKITCSKHFLLIYVEFQSLFYIQQRDRLLWFSSGYCTQQCSILFISCKQCYVPSIGISQVLVIFYLKASVSDRLVKTGIGASLRFSINLYCIHVCIIATAHLSTSFFFDGLLLIPFRHYLLVINYASQLSPGYKKLIIIKILKLTHSHILHYGI